MMRTLLALAGGVVAQRYIVMFKLPENASMQSIWASSERNALRTQRLFGAGDTIHRRGLTGYLASLSEETRARIARDPSVELVEEDHGIRISLVDGGLPRGWKLGPHQPPGISAWLHGRGYMEGRGARDEKAQNGDGGSEQDRSFSFVLQKNAPWGMSRISGHEHDYEYFENAGKAVDVYVLDTGIDIHHPEFEGRAVWGYNAVEGSPDIDEHGHGTHCAGTIGGREDGIAKYASLIAVKSLNGQGEGLISSLIEGIEFVIKDHDRKMNAYYDGAADSYFRGEHGLARGLGFVLEASGLWPALRSIFASRKGRPKAVVNMSIGGVRSAAVNFAVRYATEQMGIHFVTAAGNESDDACDFSPASSPSTITVGASGPDNQIAGFSNTGACVDLYAPGVEILSAWPNKLMKSASGTSMAAPHVAGVMAVYLSLLDLSPKDLRERIIRDSVKVVTVAPPKERPGPVGSGLGFVLEEYGGLESRLTEIEFWPFSPGGGTAGALPKESMVSLEQLYGELKTGKLKKE